MGAAVLVLLVGAGIAVALAGGGSRHKSSERARATAATAVVPPATATAPATSPALVSEAAVSAVLDRYTTAYDDESPAELLALFSSTLVRRDRNEPVQDLHRALASYRSQFRQVNSPSYVLSDIKIVPGEGQASVTARYTITDQYGTVRSPIAFHLILRNGHLLIDRITIPPGP